MLLCPDGITWKAILAMLILVSGLRFHKPDLSTIKFPSFSSFSVINNFDIHPLFQSSIETFKFYSFFEKHFLARIFQ